MDALPWSRQCHAFTVCVCYGSKSYEHNQSYWYWYRQISFSGLRLDGWWLHRMEQKISRSKLLDTVRQFEPGTLVAMEACATSHFWGRTFASMGYCVRFIPAQHVKAFVRSQKNDANDALAICETAFRPGIHFVSVKITEQQDIKALRNTRYPAWWTGDSYADWTGRTLSALRF